MNKNPSMDHTLILEENEGFFVRKMKTILESVVERMLRVKAQQLRKIWKWKSHRLGKGV